MYITIRKRSEYVPDIDVRDQAIEMVEDGQVDAKAMLIMALKYMSTDDVADMLDANELSERFDN